MEHPTFIGSNCGSPENCSEVLPENLFYGTALRDAMKLVNLWLSCISFIVEL